MKKILSILAAAAFLASCAYENAVDPPPAPAPTGKMAELSFMARMPSPAPAMTRGVGSAIENRVDDIYVLVFETGTGGNLIYKGKGRNLVVKPGSENGNEITFKATLPVGACYDLMVLANTGLLLSSISVGGSTTPKRADVEALVRTLAAGTKWSATASTLTPIPMWGEIRNRSLSSDDALVFPLTRMLARVNVEYTPANTNSPNSFEMSSIRVYNYSTTGALVPAALDSPTAPAGGYGSVLGRNPLLYNGADKIYLFEAPHNGYTYRAPGADNRWIDNPCLVIGGKYSSDGGRRWSNETFYRIDFIKKTTSGSITTEEWLSVLRNHSYNITITEVSGEGYKDPETALRSAPFNMQANILSWNDRDMGNVVFDGVFYLSVDRDEFVFHRRGENSLMADRSNAVHIKTDYLTNNDPADPTSGWHVDRIQDPNGDAATWLRLVPDARPGGWQPHDLNEAYFTFNTNPGPDNREADVWIKAGRLEYRIHVVQKILSLDLLDASNDPIDEISFVIPDAGSTGSERQTFSAEWTPSSGSVEIRGLSPVSYNPFEPGWISGGAMFPIPDGQEVACITPQPGNAVGRENYAVQPPAVSGADLAKDPFYEKATRYTFRIKNLDETIERSILLHNIHYALVVDTHKYRLDGGTHTITARSNAGWRIAKVDEWLYNVDPATIPPAQRPTSPVMLSLKTYDNLREGNTGGPNLSGEALAFTVVDNESAAHNGKWGTVYVTFESVDTPEKFPSQTVALPFPPASKLLMGLGYHDPAYAPNVGISSHFHHNSAFQMLTSPYNFGSMDESTCKVDGFRVIGYNAQGKSNGDPNGLHPDRDWHPNSMRDWLNDDQPDVIVIGSYTTDTYGTQYNDNEIRLLKEYVNNGGALILMANGLVTHEEMLGNMLEAFLDRPKGSFTTGTGGSTLSTDVRNWIADPASGAYYALENVEDPVLNGPFGDIRGKLWGAHYHTGGIKTSLLGGQAISLSDGKADDPNGRGNSGYTTIFRHKTKNFIFIGCDGFASSNMVQWQLGAYPGYGPVALDQKYYTPVARRNWKAAGAAESVPTVEVYNSVLLANAVAWALTVTNHTPPPAPGYQNQP